jgi:hypothetical protein
MITWVTLFLALVAGVHDVEIAADDTVTEIELRLDGQVVDVRRGPPWTFEVDFGRRLAPHRLEAVAQDGEGDEIARIRQRVNLPRPQAEARLALEEGGASRYRSARLIWEAMGDVKLLGFKVFFDGEPLAVENPEHIPLPEYDPEAIRVPLEVWTPVAGGGRWQESEPIGKPKKLRRRVEALRRELDRQLVIWLEGSWLPREIELSSEARQVLEWAG